jgi:hypothetical protein
MSFFDPSRTNDESMKIDEDMDYEVDTGQEFGTKEEELKPEEKMDREFEDAVPEAEMQAGEAENENQASITEERDEPKVIDESLDGVASSVDPVSSDGLKEDSEPMEVVDDRASVLPCDKVKDPMKPANTDGRKTRNKARASENEEVSSKCTLTRINSIGDLCEVDVESELASDPSAFQFGSFLAIPGRSGDLVEVPHFSSAGPEREATQEDEKKEGKKDGEKEEGKKVAEEPRATAKAEKKDDKKGGEKEEEKNVGGETRAVTKAEKKEDQKGEEEKTVDTETSAATAKSPERPPQPPGTLSYSAVLKADPVKMQPAAQRPANEKEQGSRDQRQRHSGRNNRRDRGSRCPATSNRGSERQDAAGAGSGTRGRGGRDQRPSGRGQNSNRSNDPRQQVSSGQGNADVRGSGAAAVGNRRPTREVPEAGSSAGGGPPVRPLMSLIVTPSSQPPGKPTTNARDKRTTLDPGPQQPVARDGKHRLKM